MPLRLGPGPVFIHESIAATRRWQLYALRSLFVAFLLGGLTLAWIAVKSQYSKADGGISIHGMAALGEQFYIIIASVQLALVLIVAPAATAATICQDRARGTLTHMLVTDLTNSEIVLGKLAARLAPVFALMAVTVPVLALAGLLGGIIIEAIVTLTLISLVLAIFGCTLALAISVRASKPHEVLISVYGIEAVWVLGAFIWFVLDETGDFFPMPDWLWQINPFALAYAPYFWPDAVSVKLLAIVLGVVLALSAALTAYAVCRVRHDRTARARTRKGRFFGPFRRLHGRISASMPRPSLDRDPVLWREWRRSRPSRMARLAWGTFIAASLSATVWGCYTLWESKYSYPVFLAIANGLQVSFGLLLLSLSAPTVLAEERARGKLDVLLSTPLSTDRIVRAKWLGAYRIVPALAILPAIGSLIIALSAPHQTVKFVRLGQPPAPWTVLDQLACFGLPIASFLVQGAAVTSVGVALAIWCRRLGRAVALSVSAYVLFTFGSLLGLELGAELLAMTGYFSVQDEFSMVMALLVIGTASPALGQIVPSGLLALPPSESRVALYIGQIIVILATLAFALVVYALALATFDRCMGRVVERPRRAPRQPGQIGGNRPSRAWIRSLLPGASSFTS